eukprot:m.67321 g.67321  ORF g.67321 m.67321 type:complete len:216 (-) comp14104_c1_seq1:40-687(-)
MFKRREDQPAANPDCTAMAMYVSPHKRHRSVESDDSDAMWQDDERAASLQQQLQLIQQQQQQVSHFGFNPLQAQPEMSETFDFRPRQQQLEEAQRLALLSRAQCAFEPKPGHVYHLYMRTFENGAQQPFLSLLAPRDWGGLPPCPYAGSVRCQMDGSFTACGPEEGNDQVAMQADAAAAALDRELEAVRLRGRTMSDSMMEMECAALQTSWRAGA